MAGSGPEASTSASVRTPSSRFWIDHGEDDRSPTLPSVPRFSPPRGAGTLAPLRISRVAQLDAQLLDNELEGILHGPVKTALQGIRTARGIHSARDWEPEVLAMLRLTILKMSLWGDTSLIDIASSISSLTWQRLFRDGKGIDNLREKGKNRTSEARGDATYGSSLQNLRYRNESKHTGQGLQSTAIDSRLTTIQKLFYTLLVVLPPYLNVRLQDVMMDSSWSDEPLPRSWFSLIDPRRSFVRGGRERREEEWIQWKREWKRSVWEMSRSLEKIGNMLGLFNFLIFLYNGRYRSLVDRVLKMRLVYAQRSVTPNVSFEYLNRQLVWEAFTEFLLFLMPLINLRRLKLRISKLLTSQSARSSKTVRAIATSLPTSITTALGLASLVNHHELVVEPLADRRGKIKGINQRQHKAAKTSHREGKLSFLPSTTCPICYELSTSATSTTLNPPVTRLPSSTISPIASSDPTNPSAIVSHHPPHYDSHNNNHHGNLGASSSTTASLSNPVIPSDTSVKIPYLTNCCSNDDDDGDEDDDSVNQGRKSRKNSSLGCRYCYYCIVGKLTQCQEDLLDQGWECLRCGQMVTACKREQPMPVKVGTKGHVQAETGSEHDEEENLDDEEEEAQE